MKLYKFRALANDRDLERLKGILKTGEFWCSKFSELNDPMEGVYTVLNGHNVSGAIDLIYNEKEKYKICSFSGEEAFSNPPMWGYYANGFKGMAIEIEIDEHDVEPIGYVDDILHLLKVDSDVEIKKILTSKLKFWKHEAEYRFLKESENNFHKIGEITGVYFGDPYGDVENRQEIEKESGSLSEYKKLKGELIKFAKCKGIKVCHVKIEGCKVESL